MNIPTEQEAERRYGVRDSDASETASDLRGRERAFIAGAEWSESRYRELLEAAREYRDARRDLAPPNSLERDESMQRFRNAMNRLLAAAAALNEEGGD